MIAPMYVKAFANRQKSVARDAAAIVEAAQRPTMRFVAVKTQQAQARRDGWLAARTSRPRVRPRTRGRGGTDSRHLSPRRIREMSGGHDARSRRFVDLGVDRLV